MVGEENVAAKAQDCKGDGEGPRPCPTHLPKKSERSLRHVKAAKPCPPPYLGRHCHIVPVAADGRGLQYGVGMSVM